MSQARLAIVSADGHGGLPAEGYRDYLERRYHAALDELIEEEKVFLGIMARIATYSKSQLETIDRDEAIATGGSVGGWDLPRRIREMDREGIAAEVFLEGHQFAAAPFFGLNRSRPAELRMAGVRAYHRWQAEMVDTAAGRLIGVVEQTAVPDLNDIVGEVRWAGERGFRCAKLGGTFDSNGAPPPFYAPYWEPFWAACAEYDMALVLHVARGTEQGKVFDLFLAAAQAMAPDHDFDPSGDFRDKVEDAKEADARNMMEIGRDPSDGSKPQGLFDLNYSPREVLWELLVGGVFDRYPTLKYVPTEARADWVPATLAHMDARFERGDTPLKRRPSEYWAEHCFAGASFIHRAELEQRHSIGVGTLMFGRDYPHVEGTWPNTRDWLRAAFDGVPEDEARMILGDNAIRCYGLDAAVIGEIAQRVGPPVEEILADPHVDDRLLHEFDRRGGFTKQPEPLVTAALDQIMDQALAGAAT
jgi:predicted TIM-barrel fold metal-dependent hydrolase